MAGIVARRIREPAAPLAVSSSGMLRRTPLLAAALALLSGLAACGGDTDPVEGGETRTGLHLRLTATSTYVLTDGPSGRQLGTGRLDGPASDVRASLNQLEVALASVASDPRMRSADGYSDVRLEIGAGPLVPWKYVQWALQTAASPRARIWRVAFLSGTDEAPIEIELPKDRSCCPGSHAFRLELRVKLTRTGGASGQPPFTRVRLTSAHVEYDEGYMAPAHSPSEAPVRAIDVVDLPHDAASAEERTEAWSRVHDALRGVMEADDRPLGILRAPPPSGGDTPYRDVIAAMLVLRRLGAERLFLEGAFTPLVEEDR